MTEAVNDVGAEAVQGKPSRARRVIHVLGAALVGVVLPMVLLYVFLGDLGSRAMVIGLLLSTSISYIPKSFVEANPAILDDSNEPWPGGTLHQLSTVGIEIMKVVDEVTARMPSNTEAQEWDLPPGIPLLLCRRLSYDRDDTLLKYPTHGIPPIGRNSGLQRRSSHGITLLRRRYVDVIAHDN